MSCSYRFINSSLSEVSNNRNYNVILRQQPERAKISVRNERDKRSIEPPPILQMKWINCTEEEEKKSLQSPFYFVVVNIVRADSTNDILSSQEYLSGSTVSSLHRLRDMDNTDGGFFVFGDLAVKKEGRFKLQFSLFELIDENIENRKTVYSNEFTVYTAKLYPGPIESTFLSRTFSDQGVKMRIRKNTTTTTTTTTTNLTADDEPKSRTSIRKRKCDDIPPSSSSHKTIIPNDIACYPAYASENVHFGRWQSTIIRPPTHHKSKKQPNVSLLPSPSTSPNSPYLPPITSIQQQKWMMIDDDNDHIICNRLPPLKEIVNNHQHGHSYSPFLLF
ncbi:velvet factor-domain-containing protein [Pilaira anomala]|nr:velvet factor-domain-containing protein [Pilaira anomala]